ncbi:hypothetical protein K435DRAFT_802576 [Dendrothele bispora CBS 962.96]|uniref:Uncharacterized protein n=1 Tax=Dendrothele bispora (strain CBS 962.96) TaxID=1314807 RepID=A0A4S8LKF1_DENBC|nr:hypothetical protein K435DRAFT_802576 [Dendrothele bispora CBS 962.96]
MELLGINGIRLVERSERDLKQRSRDCTSINAMTGKESTAFETHFETIVESSLTRIKLAEAREPIGNPSIEIRGRQIHAFGVQEGFKITIEGSTKGRLEERRIDLLPNALQQVIIREEGLIHNAKGTIFEGILTGIEDKCTDRLDPGGTNQVFQHGFFKFLRRELYQVIPSSRKEHHRLLVLEAGHKMVPGILGVRVSAFSLVEITKKGSFNATVFLGLEEARVHALEDILTRTGEEFSDEEEEESESEPGEVRGESREGTDLEGGGVEVRGELREGTDSEGGGVAPGKQFQYSVWSTWGSQALVEASFTGRKTTARVKKEDSEYQEAKGEIEARNKTGRESRNGTTGVKTSDKKKYTEVRDKIGNGGQLKTDGMGITSTPLLADVREELSKKWKPVVLDRNTNEDSLERQLNLVIFRELTREKERVGTRSSVLSFIYSMEELAEGSLE